MVPVSLVQRPCAPTFSHRPRDSRIYHVLGHVKLILRLAENSAFKKIWRIIWQICQFCYIFNAFIYIFFLCYRFSFHKLTFINKVAFALKSVSNINEHKTKANVEFFAGISCTQSYSSF